MAKYIERTDVLRIIDEVYGAGKVYHRVRNIPAADVAPVKHGWWIPVDEENDAFDCSECDVMVTKKYDFCPKCGAKMDLED